MVTFLCGQKDALHITKVPVVKQSDFKAKKLMILVLRKKMAKGYVYINNYIITKKQIEKLKTNINVHFIIPKVLKNSTKLRNQLICESIQ